MKQRDMGEKLGTRHNTRVLAVETTFKHNVTYKFYKMRNYMNRVELVVI